VTQLRSKLSVKSRVREVSSCGGHSNTFACGSVPH
jgi:hypothetical protein